MRILGLDLALRSTGYVLLDEDQVVWSGTVGNDTMREEERLQMFDTWIRQALRHHQHPGVEMLQAGAASVNQVRAAQISHVAVEGYSYGTPQGKTHAFGIGELGGVIKLAIHQAEIPMHIIASGTWKKVLCGHGGLDKTKAALELYKRYSVEFKSQDTLDAWAVAMCLRRQLLGLDKPEPKSRLRKTLQQTLLSPALAD